MTTQRERASRETKRADASQAKRTAPWEAKTAHSPRKRRPRRPTANGLRGGVCLRGGRRPGGCPDVRSRLLEFAGDHRRHGAELGQAIQEIGGEPAAAAPPPDTSVFGVLTSALGMVGPRAQLLGLIGNEGFTNCAYDTALELITEPNLRQLIQRNFADEQRHITWLAPQARPSEDEEPLATGEN